MLDRKTFTARMNRVEDLLEEMGDLLQWKFGTIGLEIRISGRGAPKAFRDEMRKAAARATCSAHRRITLERRLATDLPAALLDLRRAYLSASGGLEARHWNQARIDWVLANGGSAAATWTLMMREPLDRVPFRTGSVARGIARRLERHSRLDLAGPARLFEISGRQDGSRPWTVAAPDAARALARHAILRGEDPSCHAHIREVAARTAPGHAGAAGEKAG